MPWWACHVSISKVLFPPPALLWAAGGSYPSHPLFIAAWCHVDCLLSICIKLFTEVWMCGNIEELYSFDFLLNYICLTSWGIDTSVHYFVTQLCTIDCFLNVIYSRFLFTLLLICTKSYLLYAFEKIYVTWMVTSFCLGTFCFYVHLNSLLVTKVHIQQWLISIIRSPESWYFLNKLQICCRHSLDDSGADTI